MEAMLTGAALFAAGLLAGLFLAKRGSAISPPKPLEPTYFTPNKLADLHARARGRFVPDEN